MSKGSFISLSILIAVLLCSTALLAQETQYPPGHDGRPIGMTPEEEALAHLIGINHRGTAPPTGPVRAAAEWDESIGVFCLWDNAELMKELQTDNDLYIITTSGSQSWWQSWLTSNGIPHTNVKWLIASTNTWWVRDYGPWFLWDGNNDFGLCDTVYNRPRPQDDLIPQAISNAYGIPRYGCDLEHTGGNFYADGYGNGWSSTLVYTENPGWTQAQVDQAMSDYVGIDRYNTLDLEIDIEHIDTFGKPLAPDVLVWSDFPDDKSHSGWSEGALRYLQTLASPYDRPYKIYRMPLWNQGYSMTAYINSLQTQNKIVMAKHNTGNDDTAKAIFEQAAPGYTVAKVSSGGTDWGDSVHCRSRNFMRGDGVRIYAYPPGDSEDTVYGYTVRGEIYTDNSTSLNGSPLIYWTTTGGAPFSTAAMSATGNPDEYEGVIPAQPSGTTVSFYVYAEDLLGNTRAHPPVAPGWLHEFNVEIDLTPPELDHDVIHGCAAADWPPTFRARAIDNTGIPTVTLEYMINGAMKSPITMTRVPGTFLFEGIPTAAASAGDKVIYRITATDTAAAANTMMSPTEGGNTFVVTTYNKICVIDRDKTPHSGELFVNACSDFGLGWDYTTEWPSSITGYDAVIICLGMNPHNNQLTTSQANTLVSFLSAGGAAYMEGGNCFAQDSARTIYRPYFGLSGASSGSTLTGTLSGVSGEPTEGMSLAYDGDSGSSDHLTPSGADSVLRYSSYTKAVTYDTGTYATVGASFEFSGITDGNDPSRAKKLAAIYLSHLGFVTDTVVHGDPVIGGTVTLDVFGEPGDTYMTAYAYKPGYKSWGSAGVLRIDAASYTLLPTGTIPATGEKSIPINVPNSPSLVGKEVYFQSYIIPVAGSNYLTSRDMVKIHD